MTKLLILTLSLKEILTLVFVRWWVHSGTVPQYHSTTVLVFVRWWVDQIWEFPEQWQLPGDPIHSRSTSTLIINSRYFLFHILLLNQKCSMHQKKLFFSHRLYISPIQSSSLLYQSDLTLHAIKRSPAAANLKQLPHIFHPICPQNIARIANAVQCHN